MNVLFITTKTNERSWKIKEPLEKSTKIELTYLETNLGFSSEISESIIIKAIRSTIDIPKIVEQCRKNQRIIVDTLGPSLWVSILISRLLITPCSIRLRGNPIYEEKNHIKKAKINNNYKQLALHKINLFMLGVLLPLSNEYIVPSEWTIKDLPENKYNVIPTPIKPDNQTTKTDTEEVKKILCITNFDFEDKVFPLMKLLSDIEYLLHEKNIEVHILGDGYLLKEYKRKMESNDRVKLLGYDQNIRKHFNESQVFLHISNLDAYPTVILEAMLYETPVIANNCCGMKEQIEHGVTGFLIKPNKENIIQKINTIEEERVETTKIAKKRVKAENSVSSVMEKFENVLTAKNR